MESKGRNFFYAYFIPATNFGGVTDSWEECEKNILGKSEARFKKFRDQASAQEWLNSGADYSIRPKNKPGVYFDAGTGRGRGVEISVTDEIGNNLLWKVLPKEKINRHGKHWIFRDATNNYGELLACYYALEISLKDGIKNIFGDSKLILDHWSMGFVKKKVVSSDTLVLVEKVKKLRNDFEKAGGAIEYVQGDSNPADLGFHR